MDRSDDSYAFLDSGNRRRLERFGGVIVSRPAPAASWLPATPVSAWRSADLAFDRTDGWRGTPPPAWRVAFGPAVLGLHPSPSGGLGVFPEHATVADILEKLLDRHPHPHDLSVLNLFAHTGLVTLRMAASGTVAETVHVDASAGAVKTGRGNAVLSGLGEKTIRWIADDARKFMARELRRQRRYDVIVADPPAFGRSKRAKGEWKLERDLPPLAETAGQLLNPNGIFCLTGHSEGWSREEAASLLSDMLRGCSRPVTAEMELVSQSGGAPLHAGFAVYALMNR